MNWRELTVWGSTIVVSALLAGLWVSGAVAVAVVALAVFKATPARLLSVAVVLMALTPVAWLAGNWSDMGTVNPLLVTGVPWPSRLAAMALGVASIGLIAQMRTREELQ